MRAFRFLHTNHPPLALSLGLFVVTACLGCGSEQENLYTVTGNVTYRGQPLSAGYVTFVPDNAAPVRCAIDAQGDYIAKVTAGKCHLAILATSAENQPAVSSAAQAPDSQLTVASEPQSAKPLIPSKYENHKTSGLMYEVQPSDENRFDIPLD